MVLKRKNLSLKRYLIVLGNNVLDVLLWILFIGFISLICLPAYSFLFKENILIKLSLGAPISLIIVGLTSWVAFFILKEIYISYLFSITGISIIFILWLYKNRHNFFSIFNYKSLIFLLLLVISHLFFISIRGFNGDLIGTEKLMDQMMLSSTFYSDNGLVPDLWLSDYQNPYYYLAYWIFGGVIKMSGTDLVLGYNLSPIISFFSFIKYISDPKTLIFLFCSRNFNCISNLFI